MKHEDYINKRTENNLFLKNKIKNTDCIIERDEDIINSIETILNTPTIDNIAFKIYTEVVKPILEKENIKKPNKRLVSENDD